MRAGNPVALVADFEAFSAHTGAPRFLRQQHPTGWREAAGPPGGTRRPNISQAPAFLLCAACSPSPFNNLLLIPPTRFQRAAYFNASNLFDQIVSMDLCVCAPAHTARVSGGLPVCVRVCACVRALLACGVLRQPSGAALWSVTFV